MACRIDFVKTHLSKGDNMKLYRDMTGEERRRADQAHQLRLLANKQAAMERMRIHDLFSIIQQEIASDAKHQQID
jgi:hypothetical protein